jgi:hypothetical protein
MNSLPSNQRGMSGVVESADYPYTSGSAPDATTPNSPEFSFNMPQRLSGTPPDYSRVSVPASATSSERINYLVEPGSRVIKLPTGGSSEAYTVIPPGGGTPRVLKLRIVHDGDVDGMARWFSRDTAVEGVARQLAPEAKYNGESFIRVAKNLGSAEDRAVGAVWQEYVEGHSAFKIKNAADVVQGRRVVPGMSQSKAQQILREAELTAAEADSKINALENFYASVHNDVIQFEQNNGLTVLWNRRNTGIEFDVRHAGLDYGHGGNVKWSPTEKKFVIFDW